MIRPFRAVFAFDDAVMQYTRARLAWEDQWGADNVDVLLHRLLYVAERVWSFLRPHAQTAPPVPGEIPPQVIAALSNPAIARLLSSPRGALALARLIEREELRLARGVARPLDPDAYGLRADLRTVDELSGLARARRYPERDPLEPAGDLRAARSARFARARPLHEYEQEREEPDSMGELEEGEYPLDPPVRAWPCDPNAGCPVPSADEEAPEPEAALPADPPVVAVDGPADTPNPTEAS